MGGKGKRTEWHLRGMEVFYNLIGMGVTQISKCVKTIPNLCLKWMHFTVCKFSLSKNSYKSHITLPLWVTSCYVCT